MAFICENPRKNDKTRVKPFWVSRNDFIFVNFPQINVNFPNFFIERSFCSQQFQQETNNFCLVFFVGFLILLWLQTKKV